MGKSQEIGEELKSVFSGKTIDALLPPLLFVIANGLVRLEFAIILSLGVAVALTILRIIFGKPWYYAVGGLLGVGLAAGLAILTRNATNYFLPSIVSSALIFLIALISNLVGKPLAAWLSHLTRGWPFDWFWREDVKPAYTEVTWAWGLLMAMRLAIKLVLYQRGDATALGWANILLGSPVTIAVLVLSYIYGIWRLRHLGGPGVHEFREGKQPPWEGQTRGF